MAGPHDGPLEPSTAKLVLAGQAREKPTNHGCPRLPRASHRLSLSHRAVLRKRGRTTNPVCPVERSCGAFPHCGIVAHIASFDHKSLLQCL